MELKIDDLIKYKKVYKQAENLRTQLYNAIEGQEEYLQKLVADAEKEEEQLSSQILDKIDKQFKALGISERKRNEILEYYVDEYDEIFLSDLVWRNHIKEMEYSPKEYFKKMIELYGERRLLDGVSDYKFLETREALLDDIGHELEVDAYSDEEDGLVVDYYYDDEEGDIRHYVDEDVHYETIYENYTTCDATIFVSGMEDEVIGIVNDDQLKNKLFSQKLIAIANYDLDYNDVEDIQEYVAEYVESAIKNDASILYQIDEDFFYDGYGGETKLEKKLFDEYFGSPMLYDGNFYLFMAKHLDKLGCSPETFIEYIPKGLINDEFIETLNNVINTKQYEYDDKFGYHPLTQTEKENKRRFDKPKYFWIDLKKRELELSALEKEEKTISEAEELINIQNEKNGQNIGE